MLSFPPGRHGIGEVVVTCVSSGGGAGSGLVAGDALESSGDLGEAGDAGDVGQVEAG